jgi:hypothetical protein
VAADTRRALRVSVWCDAWYKPGEEHFYVDALAAAARQLRGAFVALARDARDAAPLLAALRGATCVVVLSADAGGEAYLARREAPLRDALREWTRAGGTLCWHGERDAVALLQWLVPEVTQPWTMEGDFYRRCDAERCSSCVALPPAVLRRLPRAINAKACMLSNVPQEHRLYAPAAGATAQSLVQAKGFNGTAIQAGMCTIAAAPFGQGRIVFFGDVNAEPETCAALLQLAA